MSKDSQKVDLDPNGYVRGNIVKANPKRRENSGRSVVDFTIVDKRQVKNSETNKWEDTAPVFVEVHAYGALGDHVLESFKRGHRVMAVGEFYRIDEPRSDGQGTFSNYHLAAREVGASVLFSAIEMPSPTRAATQDAPSGDFGLSM